mmetsp:Transcript_437/g.819  ORF Transcript_437/g.819 Transcript_437/m.819 type:complete len:532 (-) Transcript_437:52-1647(-)
MQRLRLLGLTLTANFASTISNTCSGIDWNSIISRVRNAMKQLQRLEFGGKRWLRILFIFFASLTFASALGVIYMHKCTCPNQSQDGLLKRVELTITEPNSQVQTLGTDENDAKSENNELERAIAALADPNQEVVSPMNVDFHPSGLPKGMLEYIAWHNLQVSNPSKDVKRVIYLCENECGGGLGDRLRGILFLFYYCVLTKKMFGIEWSYPSPLQESFEPRYLDWLGPIKQCPTIRNATFIAYNLPFDEAKQILESEDDCVFVKTNARYLYDDMWDAGLGQRLGVEPTNQSYYPLSTWGLNILFKPSFELERTYSELLKEWNMTRDQPFIGMHVRLGSYGVHYRDPRRHPLDSLVVFSACAKAMKEYLESQISRANPSAVIPVIPIFVASDANLAKENISRTLEHVKYVPEEAFHIDRSFNHFDKTFNRSLHSVRTMAEFVFLARSSCIVASRSGFSSLSVFWSLSTKTQQRCWVWQDEWRHKHKHATIRAPFLAQEDSAENITDLPWFSHNGLTIVRWYYFDTYGHSKFT